MRRGLISLGDVQCDLCHQTVPHSERYLAIEEKDGVEAEEGQTAKYCVECAIQKGYGSYKVEKHEKTLTFFP